MRSTEYVYKLSLTMKIWASLSQNKTRENPDWFQIGRVNTTSGEWELLGPVSVDPSGETVTFQTTRLGRTLSFCCERKWCRWKMKNIHQRFAGTFAVLLTEAKGLQEIADLGVIATPSPQVHYLFFKSAINQDDVICGWWKNMLIFFCIYLFIYSIANSSSE